MLTDIYPYTGLIFGCSDLGSDRNICKTEKLMPTYSPNMKLCATCAHWGGARKIDPTRSFVSTTSRNERGECLGGGHNTMQTPATGTCNAFTKWPVLR